MPLSLSTAIEQAPSQERFISKGNISSHTATLSILQRDAKLSMQPTIRQSHTSAFIPRREAGSTTKFAQKARRNLTLVVRNTIGLTHFLTLNYGSVAPEDDRIVKRHLDRIKVWLTRRGVSLVWRQEFTKSGRPHFHILLSKPIAVSLLRAQWNSIIGAGHANFTVHLRAIRNDEQARKYLVKGRDDQANFVPSGYRNMGRFWGRSGKLPSPELASFEGTRKELAPLLRLLKRICYRGLAVRRGRDNGMRGMLLWTAGGPCLLQDLERYWAALQGQRGPKERVL